MNTTDEQAKIDKILENLLSDRVDMYAQDRDSSAALGADLQVAKAAIVELLINARVKELRMVNPIASHRLAATVDDRIAKLQQQLKDLDTKQKEVM